MQKTLYKKELTISATQKRGGATNNKKDIKKVQAWLTLFDLANPGSGTTTGIDGDFGQATEKALINFQKIKRLSPTGIADAAVFNALCQPLKDAFEKPVTGSGLRQRVLNVAKLHMAGIPFELVIDKENNCGPWVRSYMDGHEGEEWFWCMGFVQAIIDQAAASLGKNFKTLMPLTYSCDVVGETGLQKGLLTRFAKLRQNPALAQPGDVFLLQKSQRDWMHTGIILSVGDGILETMEGNTNSGGSHNGNRVCKRIRNFRQSPIDVFSIEPLVQG